MNITDNATYVTEWISEHHTGLRGFIEGPNGWMFFVAGFLLIFAACALFFFWPHKETLAERISKEEQRRG